MMTREELPACPMATTVRIVGSKWKLMILRELLSGTKRYTELRRGIPSISQKVLTENLRAMEQDGIVYRTAYAEVPPRVEYTLTELGAQMRPIMEEMMRWGLNYQNIVREGSAVQ